MPARPYMLVETTWKTVRDGGYDVAVLPWGATEAHNTHLPYGTDNFECDHIAAEAARLAWERGAKVVVLPAVPFGVQTGQLDIPLCLNLNPSTQLGVLHDLSHVLDATKYFTAPGEHAGEAETSMIQHLAPDLVRPLKEAGPGAARPWRTPAFNEGWA